MIEPEVMDGRRAFPETQRLFAGEALEGAPALRRVGWHGTQTHTEDGAFAVVPPALDRYVGEVVQVNTGGRSCFVYVLAARDVPVDLSLTRRAFLSLAPLWMTELLSRTEVIR